MQTTACENPQPQPVPDESQTGSNAGLRQIPSGFSSPPSSLGEVSGLVPLPSEAVPTQVSGLIPHPSEATFPRLPGETPRAFSAFLAFFQLGHRRSLAGLADHLGEKHDTVKFWSSKYRWSDRLNAFNSGVLERQAEGEATTRCRQAADWARRTGEYREQEWAIAQKLLLAAQCFLENLGEREVEKMSLAQVSRALEIYARLARHSLSQASPTDTPALTPLQLEIEAALRKAFAAPAPAHPQN